MVVVDEESYMSHSLFRSYEKINIASPFDINKINREIFVSS